MSGFSMMQNPDMSHFENSVAQICPVLKTVLPWYIGAQFADLTSIFLNMPDENEIIWSQRMVRGAH